MKFEFFLPQNGTLKNIHLSLTDTQQKETLYFRTSLKIQEKDWDKEKQRPTNIYLKKHKKLNDQLDTIKLHMMEYIREKRNKGKKTAQRTLAKEIKKACSSQSMKLPENSLLYFMEWYINSRKGLICHSTYKRYMVFYHLIKRFEGFMMERLYPDTMNEDFIRDFLLFGREEEYSESTLYRTIHFVKTILNFAERKGCRTCVTELEIKRERKQKEVITLTEQEITRIKVTEIPEQLQSAKDWLLVSCYTGQRFSDFMRFNIKQLKTVNGKTCISFIQQKTHKQVLLPLHPTVLKILNKYNHDFPEPMNIQDYNDRIRQIAKLACINDSIRARKRIGYRVKDLQTEKWNVISSHIGRRSFATNFYGRIPTPLLMEATGHSSEQMFLEYINPIDEGRVLSLGSYFEKN